MLVEEGGEVDFVVERGVGRELGEERLQVREDGGFPIDERAVDVEGEDFECCEKRKGGDGWGGHWEGVGRHGDGAFDIMV